MRAAQAVAAWQALDLSAPAANLVVEPIVSPPATPKVFVMPSFTEQLTPSDPVATVVPPEVQSAPAAAHTMAADTSAGALEAFAAAARIAPRPVGRMDIRGRPASSASSSQVPPVDPLGSSLRSHLVAEVRRPVVGPAVGEAVRVGLPAAALDELGSLKLTAPQILAIDETLDHRSRRSREQLVQAMGGTAESEAAVAAGLAFLARNQEPDGRWTWIDSPELDLQTGGRPPGRDDSGLTGLAVLCFLAADCTGGEGTPHGRQVRRGLEWLLARQKTDGDLRGESGDMYCQGIATLALGEAAAMTRRPAYGTAAVRGARFILGAHNAHTGGWRYVPGDIGDTSVLGWQVMALHSVQRLGVPIPGQVRKAVGRWLASVSRSRHGMLAGYQSTNPTPTMTAEALFARLLLGEDLTPAQQAEAIAFFHPPADDQGPDFYYCYYASLALMQLQAESWPRFNARVRDYLIALQVRSGPHDGSWDAATSRWGSQRGGRIYATALATLTLEVYYRYLPMYVAACPGKPARPGEAQAVARRGEPARRLGDRARLAID